MTTTLVLTEEQAINLRVYLLITTKYRLGEIKACRELSLELKEDGSPRFPNMASNADWWEKTDKVMKDILKQMDGDAKIKEALEK